MKKAIGITAAILLFAAAFGVTKRLVSASPVLEAAVPSSTTGKTPAVCVMRTPFDLDMIVSGRDVDNVHTFNTAVFRGVINNVKSYALTWKNSAGEECGPYFRTVLDVTIIKDHKGNLPGGEIKVLLTSPLTEDTAIRSGGEYVFLNSWLLDELYFENLSEMSPDSFYNDTSLREADVTVGAEWNSIFLISDGNVRLYHEYLDRIEHSYVRE
ncbi:MAG: hypothetical protein K6C36_04160 [Clostridia bacterium]|nr:hypothetical protein [Clostridia bacterium]